MQLQVTDIKGQKALGAESPQRSAIFENLLLKQCILDIFQLKFSLKI